MAIDVYRDFKLCNETSFSCFKVQWTRFSVLFLNMLFMLMLDSSLYDLNLLCRNWKIWVISWFHLKVNTKLYCFSGVRLVYRNTFKIALNTRKIHTWWFLIDRSKLHTCYGITITSKIINTKYLVCNENKRELTYSCMHLLFVIQFMKRRLMCEQNKCLMNINSSTYDWYVCGMYTIYIYSPCTIIFTRSSRLITYG